MNLMGFLLAALVVLVVLYVTKILVGYMELDQPIRQIVMLIVALLCLLFLLAQLGLVSGGPVIRFGG